MNTISPGIIVTGEVERFYREVAASRIALGFPHDFLASDGVRELVYGGMYAVIDPHQR